MAVLCAALLAWTGARLLFRFGEHRARLLDFAGDRLRKLHSRPTPRVGGIAVAAGFAGGVAAAWLLRGDVSSVSLLFLCVSPGLVWGLVEDVTKRGAALVRLVVSAVAATAGFVLLDARITQVDVPAIDHLLKFHVASFAFTLFAVAGVANAINVIDGLNGLSGITTLLASVGLAIVAWIVGDLFVFQTACILAASIAGFLAVNFPSGRIFLGDGGAYLIGLLLAELSVLLVHRNVAVSAWFPLVLLAYPIWETLFSMYRRRRRGHPAGRADALHLHTLVYRRIVRWKGPRGSSHDRVVRNSLASLCLWIIPLATWAFAILFWDDLLVLQAAACGFAFAYVVAYRRIVRFRVPRRIIVRAGMLDADAASAKPR
jgi:UDP-N-acetylmuramyl pentapeptide phosphotransferase/UDP-N-acetylglucosamine-1-phosphate transferase